jgi:hypothetical protein
MFLPVYGMLRCVNSIEVYECARKLVLPAEARTGLGCPTLYFATKGPSYRVQPSGRQPNDQFCDWSSTAKVHLTRAAEGVQVALAAVAVRAAHALQRSGLGHRLAGP